VTGADAGGLGRVFDEVPELYDRTRPTYPDALFAELTEMTGLGRRSRVLEVGCGTGQATRSLASLGCQVTAVEPGDGLAALARQRLAAFGDVSVESSTFEDWDDRGRRFDVLVAASSWHWVDPAAGWPKARDVLNPGGWMALLGNVTIRRPGEPEVYAETADLHERFAPGNPSWGHPPLEDEVRAGSEGWGHARREIFRRDHGHRGQHPNLPHIPRLGRNPLDTDARRRSQGTIPRHAGRQHPRCRPDR
jgi:SAM-dependent methyltransferase